MEKVMREFLMQKAEMDKKEREGDESYNIEFMKLVELTQKLKLDEEYSTSEGEKSQNSPKNRYKDILPFNHCRVKLQSGSEGDYINASFINSPTQQRYIATQGPLQRTLEDFWNMAWQQGVTTIVMACLENEGFPSKPKCQRYWGSETDGELRVGPFTIKKLEEVVVAESEGAITHKRLLVKKGGEERTLNHIHHTVWPDKLIPTCVTSILLLIHTIRSIHPFYLPNPLLVHCSAGCGRTGTIIVIDYIRTLLMTKQLSAGFSVFELVCSMRKQRTAIVQTQEQYHYVHMAVERMFQEDLEQNSYSEVNKSASSNGPVAKSATISPSSSSSSPSHYSSILLNKKLPLESESVEAKDVEENDYENFDHVPPKLELRKKISGGSSSSISSLPKPLLLPPSSTQPPPSSTLPPPPSSTLPPLPSSTLPPPPFSTLPPPSSSTHPPKLFLGHDIGFPNRVEKPQGPRPMPAFLR